MMSVHFRWSCDSEFFKMTVKYTLDVSTSRPWIFFKLLFKWNGSVWKAVVLELIVWLILYALFSVVYRFALDEGQQSGFESTVAYLDDRLKYIPLDLMLGFFVTSVLNRWNLFFAAIGYIDNTSLMVAAYLRGTDEKTRKMRRNVVRYCVLAQALVFRDISMRVRKRFPTIDTLIAAGFMMEHEKKRYDEIQYHYAKYWLPFQWAFAILVEARQQQRIASDYLLHKIYDEIRTFRTNMEILSNYDWVTLPIMYPQLIVLTVHIYFLICSVGRQFIVSDGAPNKSKIDLVFPIMTVLQFIFYMGWLKVAEVILNPFGEDADDFECNFLLDKNITIGLTIVDEGYGKTPQMIPDVFWNKPVEPLYTIAAAHMEHQGSGITGSTAHVKIPERHVSVMVPLVEEAPEIPPFALRFRNSVDVAALRHRNSFAHPENQRIPVRSISHMPGSTWRQPNELVERKNMSSSNLSVLELRAQFPTLDAKLQRLKESEAQRDEDFEDLLGENSLHSSPQTKMHHDLEKGMEHGVIKSEDSENGFTSVNMDAVAARLADLMLELPQTNLADLTVVNEKGQNQAPRRSRAGLEGFKNAKDGCPEFRRTAALPDQELNALTSEPQKDAKPGSGTGKTDDTTAVDAVDAVSESSQRHEPQSSETRIFAINETPEDPFEVAPTQRKSPNERDNSRPKETDL